MKRSCVRSWIIVFPAILLVFAVAAYGQISGSAHDFSNLGWSTGEICVVCHTPHNANSTVSSAPLWNHTLSNTPYLLYTSPTLDVTVEQPTGDSKLCLSCHDGTIAVDSFGGLSGNINISTFNNGGTQPAGYAEIGTNLQDDHPVSFEWGHETIESGDCVHCHQGGGGGGGGGIQLTSPLIFPDGRVECSTCHDVHNTAAFENLLRMTMQGSTLCLHCHTK